MEFVTRILKDGKNTENFFDREVGKVGKDREGIALKMDFTVLPNYRLTVLTVFPVKPFSRLKVPYFPLPLHTLKKVRNEPSPGV